MHVKMAEPVFEGQTKGRLGSKVAREAVNQITSEKLSLYYDANPKEAKKILERINFAFKKRIAAKKSTRKHKKKNYF